MAFSVGLTLYNMVHGRPAGPPADWPPRPAGRLVWLHAPSGESVSGLAELGRRLAEEDGVTVLLTLSGTGEGPPPPMLSPAPPADSAAEVGAFLNHWAPDLILLAEGEMRPALMHEAAARKLPVLLVEGRSPRLLHGRDRWYPGLMRACLASLHSASLLDDAAARAFRKAGLDPERMRVGGRLESTPLPLPYLEAERAALAALLAGRPVWLAMSVPPAEHEAVIAAHRLAQGQSHRLLLILVPQDQGQAADLARRLEADEGWQVARRGAEQEPDPDIEVFIADQPGEAGLWYRLAPVTYLGGSLAGPGCIDDPLAPATTGSAIIHGPLSGDHDRTCARLGAALAARMVASAPDLGHALTDLLSPDQAARQAHAAWGVVSEGAELSEALVTQIRALMDGDR
ncbi:MAG: 3-deoxy-D-manno-octulosonic acid transferase [Paracoccaceae bacterium]